MLKYAAAVEIIAYLMQGAAPGSDERIAGLLPVGRHADIRYQRRAGYVRLEYFFLMIVFSSPLLFSCPWPTFPLLSVISPLLFLRLHWSFSFCSALSLLCSALVGCLLSVAFSLSLISSHLIFLRTNQAVALMIIFFTVVRKYRKREVNAHILTELS